MCAKTERNTNSVFFPHETRQTQISWSLGSWATMRASCWSPNRLCSLFVSEFPKQGMDSRSLPGTVETLRPMCSPSNSQSRSKYREKPTTAVHTGRKGQTGDDGQNSACTALQKHAGNSGKTKPPRCAGFAHQPKDVFVLRIKLCSSKRVQRETNRRTYLVSTQNAPQNGCETAQGRERTSQFMFVSALRTKHETSLHSWMTCPQNWLAVLLDTSR